METFVNGTTALLASLQEELVSIQRNTLEENLVPILVSASTSAIVLGEIFLLSYFRPACQDGRQSTSAGLYHPLFLENRYVLTEISNEDRHTT